MSIKQHEKTLRIAIIATTSDYRHSVALTHTMQKKIIQNKLCIELVFAYLCKFNATDAASIPEGVLLKADGCIPEGFQAVARRRRGENERVYPSYMIEDESTTQQRHSLKADGYIKTRSYQWLLLDKQAAYRAMTYAGFKKFVPHSQFYEVPDDSVQQFTDCQMWIFDTGPFKHSLLPICPYIVLTDSTLPDNLNQLSFLPTPLATTILQYWDQTRSPL